MATLICMKKTLLLPLLLLSLIVSLNSCLKGESHYTPQVIFHGFLTTAGDTLHLSLGRDDDYVYLDTISVQDTVLCYVEFTPLGNNLLRTQIQFDTTYLSLSSNLSNIMEVVDTANSDLNKLSIAYKQSSELGFYFNGVTMGVRMVPHRNGETKVRFGIASDSKFSPTERTMVVRIADRN